MIYPIVLPKGRSKRDGVVGYIDETGKVVAEPAFDVGWISSNGLAAVKSRGRWGFLSEDGRVAIEPRFQSVWTFGADYGLVSEKRGGPCFFVDRSGARISDYQVPWQNLGVQEGVVIVEDEAGGASTCHYCDPSGALMGGKKFMAARPFSEGLATTLAGPGEPWRILDRLGKEVLRIECALAYGFGCGLCRIDRTERNEGGSQEYVKLSGDRLVPPLEAAYYDFSEGFAPFEMDGKWGLINQAGAMIVGPRFGSLFRVSNGMSSVRIGDHYGFVDTSGEVVVPAIYNICNDYFGPLALVHTDKVSRYIDKNGKVVWEGVRVEAALSSMQ